MNELPEVFVDKAEAEDHPVVTFLQNHGIGFLDRSDASDSDVSKKTGIPEEELSEQYPLVKWTDGTLLRNCDTDQLIKFLRNRGHEFEDS